MANEQELQLDPIQEGGGGKKKLIIIIIAVVLVIGIAIGATLFLLSGSEEAPAEAEGSEPEEQMEVASTAGPAIYIKLKPEFIVNYQVGTRQRYLQIYIEAMTRNPEIADALNTHSPMIRSSIIGIMGDQEFESLRTPEGRVKLKELITEEVQRLLTQETGVEGGLESILFTNFVMQ